MLQLRALKAKRDSGTASPDIDTKALCSHGAFFVQKNKEKKNEKFMSKMHLLHSGG